MVRIFDRINPPYFQQKYNDDHTSLAGEGEDTGLHRRLADAGVPMYVNWDFWAGHVVDRLLQKPKALTDFERMLILTGLQ